MCRQKKAGATTVKMPTGLNCMCDSHVTSYMKYKHVDAPHLLYATGGITPVSQCSVLACMPCLECAHASQLSHMAVSRHALSLNVTGQTENTGLARTSLKSLPFLTIVCPANCREQTGVLLNPMLWLWAGRCFLHAEHAEQCACAGLHGVGCESQERLSSGWFQQPLL